MRAPSPGHRAGARARCVLPGRAGSHQCLAAIDPIGDQHWPRPAADARMRQFAGSIGITAMSPLAVVSNSHGLTPQVGPSQLAHHHAKPGQTQVLPPGTNDRMAPDLRNLLATVALHLETLQRLSGPSGAKAADAAHALLARGATLCNGILDWAARNDGRARRRGVDLVQIARHVADLLGPITPKDFAFD